MSCQQTEDYLHQKIPLTRAMGVRVRAYEGGRLTLADPAIVAAFRETFTRTGKASLKLRVTLEEEGRLAVEFHGTFVALGDRQIVASDSSSHYLARTLTPL